MINTGLSIIGYYWVLLSIVATMLSFLGFYMPYWIVGTLDLNNKKNEVYFGSFRRCNYPVFDPDLKQFKIVNECGRYASFYDIPSFYWQVSTVFIGSGCLISLILVLIMIPSCCLKHIISRNSAIVVGLAQVVAGVLVVSGCVFFPLGWGNQEVKDACGNSASSYMLGECELGWAYFCMMFGSALLLICGAMSNWGGRSSQDPPPEYPSYRNRFKPDEAGVPPNRFSFDAETLIDHNLRRHSIATANNGRRLSNQRMFRPLNPPSHLPVCDI